MSDDEAAKLEGAQQAHEIRQTMKAYRGGERSAHDLSMLVDLDEPELFVREALKVLDRDERWKIVVEALRGAEEKLKAANEPPKRTS